MTAGSQGWDIEDPPIKFFFVSTRPPTIGDYNLINSEVGTGQSFAPTPEPGLAHPFWLWSWWDSTPPPVAVETAEPDAEFVADHPLPIKMLLRDPVTTRDGVSGFCEGP